MAFETLKLKNKLKNLGIDIRELKIDIKKYPDNLKKFFLRNDITYDNIIKIIEMAESKDLGNHNLGKFIEDYGETIFELSKDQIIEQMIRDETFDYDYTSLFKFQSIIETYIKEGNVTKGQCDIILKEENIVIIPRFILPTFIKTNFDIIKDIVCSKNPNNQDVSIIISEISFRTCYAFK